MHLSMGSNSYFSLFRSNSTSYKKWFKSTPGEYNGSCINHGTNGKIKKTQQIKELKFIWTFI